MDNELKRIARQYPVRSKLASEQKNKVLPNTLSKQRPNATQAISHPLRLQSNIKSKNYEKDFYPRSGLICYWL